MDQQADDVGDGEAPDAFELPPPGGDILGTGGGRQRVGGYAHLALEGLFDERPNPAGKTQAQ